MAESTGWVIAAAGIAAANEAVFAPTVAHTPLWKDFNWRLIPVTAVAGFMLAGVEAFSPPLGKMLGVITFLAALVFAAGKANSPIDNLIAMLGLNKK